MLQEQLEFAFMKKNQCSCFGGNCYCADTATVPEINLMQHNSFQERYDSYMARRLKEIAEFNENY